MTVSYQYEVASSTSGGFTRLLFMWRGSLYKLIYRELLLFLVAFGVLSAMYRNIFTEEQKRLFEKVVIYCDTFINLIPLSFVLGFYVAYVAGRWWQQYIAIPWPDKVMHSLALYVGGNDEYGRMLRRTLMRYLNLSLILVLRSISSAVKRRFPTMDHLVEAGFMTPLELQMFQAVPNVEFNTYWIPCTWFICLLKEAKKENKNLCDSQGLKVIVEEFNEYRSKCGLLWSYDWISIPLVYTQVVTLATYSFFLAALVGRQYVDHAKKPLQMEIDTYLPVFTILQFFFFMGLLKVAEQLINPFGDDDEDFELNWLIDRHTKVSYLGVDTLMKQCPPLVKDKYFDEINLILPYTGAAFAYKKKTYRGSVHNMQVPEDQQGMFLPEITEEDEDDNDNQSVKRSTPKTSSFSSLLNAGSCPTAGIWRSSLESCNSDCPSLLEDGVRHTEVKITPGIDRNKKHLPWHAAVNPAKPPPQIPSFVSSDFPKWSSISTLDSASSNSGLQLHEIPVNPFDKSFRKNTPSQSNVPTENSIPIEHHNGRNSLPQVLPKKKGICARSLDKFTSSEEISNLRQRIHKHTSSFGSRDKPKLHKLLARRQSTSSGQWKGVRWKPVIDDSAGDSWSDNTERRPSNGVCHTCKHPATAPADISVSPPAVPPRGASLISESLETVASSYQSLCTNFSTTLNDPMTVNKSSRSKSFAYLPIPNGEDTISIRSSIIGNSLPNITPSTISHSHLVTGSFRAVNNDSTFQGHNNKGSNPSNDNLMIHDTKRPHTSNTNFPSNL